VTDASPPIIVGVHPRDTNASWLLALALSTDHHHGHYTEERKKAIAIGLKCYRPCDEHSFCESLGSEAARDRSTVLATDIGDALLLGRGSQAGMKLQARHEGACEATEEGMWRFGAVEEVGSQGISSELHLPAAGLPDLPAMGYGSSLLEDLGWKCVASGRCPIVCPTCDCSHVQMARRHAPGARVLGA